MAITFVNVGTTTHADSGNITPALPASIQAGDILILVVSSADNVAVTLPAAYTIKVASNAGSTNRLTVAWARATGSDSAPLVTHSGVGNDEIVGWVAAYRGCKSSGDPFTDAQIQANTGVTTVNTAPSITPVAGDMVIFASGTGEGGTNNGNSQSLSGWSGTNPTFTERADYNDQGLGSRLDPAGFADGTSTGGATGTRTVAYAVTPQATANGAAALLALTQDAGGSLAGPITTPTPSPVFMPGMPPVTFQLPTTPDAGPSVFTGPAPVQYQNPVSPPLGLNLPLHSDITTPEQGPSVYTGPDQVRYLNPLSPVLGLNLPVFPQPVPPAVTTNNWFSSANTDFFVFNYQTNGVRTRFGSASTDFFVFSIQTAGIHASFGRTIGRNLVFNYQTNGVRTRFGSTTTPLVFNYQVAGARQTYSSTTTPLVFNIQSAGIHIKVSSTTTALNWNIQTTGGKLGAKSSTTTQIFWNIQTTGTGGQVAAHPKRPVADKENLKREKFPEPPPSPKRVFKPFKPGYMRRKQP